MAYEALYRRYRPSRFEDAFFGQAHIVAALRNAVESDRVGHAYLFSGPRGTGKTTSARILAKALNCTNLAGGEPCDTCDSCEAFNTSSSYDLHELDAASNNGVDAMRDLIGKVALGSPGRTKVYILDEVHMLSSGAENALLKTLEEPPPHVVFVLCTTEPNKVVPTIRSRTQHLEFSLLAPDDVGELVDYIVADADLEITDADRSWVIRTGGGSARDTLSALDQVVAAGGAPSGGEHLERLLQALAERDGPAALMSIDAAMQAGRDPATIATAVLAELRGVFLATMRADLSHLPATDRERAETLAASLPPARITRALEVLGTAVVEMRQAPEPRIDLEVAVIRLTRGDLDVSPAALLERIEALEAGAPAAPAAATAVSPPVEASTASPTTTPPANDETPGEAPADDVAPPPVEAVPDTDPVADAAPAAAASLSEGKRGAAIARAELARMRQGDDAAPTPAAPPPAATPSPEAAGDAPTEDAPPAPVESLADRRRARQQAAAAASSEDSTTEAASEPAAPTAPPQETPVEPVVEQPVDAEAAAPPVAEHAPVEATPEPAPLEVVQTEEAPPETAEPAATPPAAAPAGGALPPVEQLTAAWATILETMPGRVRSRFSAGTFLPHANDSAVMGLPNPVHRDRCEEVRDDVDAAFTAHFGAPVPLQLIVDSSDPEPDFFDTPAEPISEDPESLEEEVVDLDALVDAKGHVPSGVDRVLATFEGSAVVEDPSTEPSNER